MRRYRSEWPIAPIHGSFLVAESALDTLDRILPTYRSVDGLHEGIAFLCGVEKGDLTVLLTAIAPEADHGVGHVSCSAKQMAAVSAAARSFGLGVLTQVHSHPSPYTGHSFGDDEMIFMPFEGMLSIVVPSYGRFGVRPLDSLGVHQFQNGRWVLCERESVRRAIAILPAKVDLR
jgi:hypothetical protein